MGPLSRALGAQSLSRSSAVKTSNHSSAARSSRGSTNSRRRRRRGRSRSCSRSRPRTRTRSSTSQHYCSNNNDNNRGGGGGAGVVVVAVRRRRRRRRCRSRTTTRSSRSSSATDGNSPTMIYKLQGYDKPCAACPALFYAAPLPQYGYKLRFYLCFWFWGVDTCGFIRLKVPSLAVPVIGVLLVQGLSIIGTLKLTQRKSHTGKGSCLRFSDAALMLRLSLWSASEGFGLQNSPT